MVDVSRERAKWYDQNADNPPWIKALAEVRQLAPREGCATSMFKQSSLQLTSTRKQRWATANFF